MLLCTLGAMAASSPALARAGRLVLAAAPPTLVVESGATRRPSARITLKVARSRGALVKLVALAANIGRIAGVKRVAPGRWVASYHPPRMSRPGVALLRAEVTVNGVLRRRWLAVRLALRRHLVVRTQGAAEIFVSVQGREFGPVHPKGRQRSITVPVILPPGASSYTVTRVTASGTTSAKTRKLPRARFARMAMAGPRSAPAGSTIRLDIFVVGSRGERYTHRVPVLVDCPFGKIVRLRGQRSAQTLWVKLSPRVGVARLHASLRDAPSVSAVHKLRVLPANRLRLVVSVSQKRLSMVSTKSVQVLVKVTDLYGNPARTPSLDLRANGQPLAVARLEPGLWRGWLVAPSGRQPRDRVEILATAPRAHVGRARVLLLGGAAVKLKIRLGAKAIMANGRRGVDVFVEAKDRFGMDAIDRSVKITSDRGRMEFLHRVVMGRFRGRFIPDRLPKGGLAEITASTRNAGSVTARLKLLPIPQQWVLSAALGTVSDLSRAVGLGALARLEYSVYAGPPSTYIGAQMAVTPHFGVGNRQPEDPFAGFSVGVTALGRMRLVGVGPFRLDALLDVGLMGVYSAYKRSNPPAIDSFTRGRVGFTASLSLELGLATTGGHEVLLGLTMRYQTIALEDARSDNHLTVGVNLGYRFAL